MKFNPFGPKPKPLTPEECESIWRWELAMIRFYMLAMVLISLGFVAVWAYRDLAAVRIAVLLGVGALTVIGAWVQFRERCPRCSSLIGRQARLILPLKCKHCGVEFPRRKDRGHITELS
jgi:hypothetical protein